VHGLHQVRPRDPSDPIIPKGSAALKEGLVRAWAYALALLVLAFPLFNPDVYWQLSAGRWIWAHHAVPRVDVLSFTRAGTPWIDFEWLTQAVWYAVERTYGLWGLWALKAGLLAAAFLSVDGLLRDKGATRLARAAAAALWSGAALGVADLRADLPTLLLFGVLLRRLEAGRASFLFGFCAFALWGNLHAGLAAGFALYAIYWTAARARARPAAPIFGEALGAFLGAALNPYGYGVFRVFLAHASAASATNLVMEWQSPSWRHPFQIPLLMALVVVAAAAVADRRGRRRASPALLAATALFGAAAVASARFGGLFATAGTALAFAAFPAPALAPVALGLLALTPAIPIFAQRWRYPFHDNYVARRAVEFVAREEPVLGKLRLFNQYEWGGFLGWRMGEGYPVFGDGRYLFADQLSDIAEALTAPEKFADFAASRRLDGFLIADYPATTVRSIAGEGGEVRPLARPWYVESLPRERWALVYWDDQALVFVDRARVPAAWLAAHEYRWLHPKDDDAALAAARARGWIDEAALAREKPRHEAEVAELAAALSGR
jgi:hypothetical protein